jgi:pyridoxal biosynthesis lyase PdxS
MSNHEYTEQELRLTAAIYATNPELVEYVRKNGKIPGHFRMGGLPTAMNVMIRQRGVDIILTESEQLVFDAIILGKRLPFGGVILVDKT